MSSRNNSSDLFASKEFKDAVRAEVDKRLEQVIVDLQKDISTLQRQNQELLSLLSGHASGRKDDIYDRVHDHIEKEEPIYTTLDDDPLAEIKNELDKMGNNNYYEDESQTAKCATCSKDISGKQTLTALGKNFHPDCFICSKCRNPITDDKFRTNQDKPYCGDCYAEDFMPKCHSCRKPIKEKAVKGLGYSWHPEHFVCAICKASLVNSSFIEKNDKAYCKTCFDNNYADKCKGCSKPISEKTIVALDAKWHPDCFKCVKCSKPITGETFHVVDKKPKCVEC